MSVILERLRPALADRYHLERELGAGGMATVYLARDVRHDRQVALKVLRPELSAILGGERFLTEIKTTANLQHPHILSLFDSGEADGLVFYVMPYVEGESLRDRLLREKQLPVDDAVRITREVASALDYAHRHGVVHRDIKPENILLHEGQALVADFGIALAASRSEGRTRMTETGMSLGTPHYMSPEQAMGEREITPKADIYALGCVLYEMLTGEPPFSGPTAQAIIARVMTEEPRLITLQRRTVPAHVEAATLTALAKLPADRFATAAQFADALAGAGPALPSRVAATSATQSVGSARWRRRFQAASGVALLAVAFGAWGWVRARAAGQSPVARHYITLGDNVQLQAFIGGALALSPDGSRLAFLGDSLNRVWIKRRDELTPIMLPGTEGAANLTFSPDGQWIAYVADGHLKRVRADGGASVTIADSVAGGFGGATWLDDGSLVFVPQSLLGLRRVNASGGTVSVVMADSGLGGLGVSQPTALPHARGVLFQGCSSGCVTMTLRVLDLKTGVQKLLLNDVAAGWYLPSGHLLYVRRDGVALVAPFDLTKLQIHGAAVPVLEGVSQGLSLVQMAWSTSGTLVYQIGGPNNELVTVQRVDRSGAATPIDSSWTGQFNSFALSPDERRMAVGATTSGAGLNIWIKQLDRGPFTRFTFGGQDRRPTWSPDGRQVAFVRDSAGGADIYARPADGGGRDRRIAHLDRTIQEVTWSPDGHWVIVRTDNSQAGNGDIVAVRTDGDSTPVSVAASGFTELHPALSPDSRWLAYTSNEGGTNEIYVRPFPHADAGRWQVSNGGGEGPRWSADGKELYFLDPGGHLVAAQVKPGPTFTVASLRILFDASRLANDGYHQAFEVTKNGRFIFLGPLHAAAPARTVLVQVDNWFADVRARLAP